MKLRRSILVIDQPGGKLEQLCCKVLEPELQVCCAADQSSVEKAITDGLCRLVVVDGQQNNGLELFACAKAMEPSMIGVLVCDGKDPGVLLAGMKSGFLRAVPQPVDEKELENAVFQSLDHQQLMEDGVRMRTLLPLYELGQHFFRVESEEDIYAELIRAVMEVVDVPKISVMIFDSDIYELRVVAHRGLDPQVAAKVRVKPGEQIAGKVFQSGSPAILYRDRDADPLFAGLLKRSELSAAICFPMIYREEMLGVLNISDTQDGALFRRADLDMLSVICNQAMMALQVLRAGKEREEKSRILALLEQHVSPEVSTLLLEHRTELMEQGILAEMTVLFADIRNFTLLAQHFPTKDIRKFLNSFFDAFTSIVFSRKGMLDKFMGDGALVVFGAPFELECTQDVAVKSGTDMIAAFEEQRLAWGKRHPVFEQIGLGVGISRGQIFLGNVGSVKRLDYTVLGTDVNIAQRLATHAASGEILITEHVLTGLCDQYPFRGPQKVNLRGVENEVLVYRLR